MNLNIFLIILLAILIGAMADGYKKGMVREIISFVSLIITCVVVALLGNALSNYFDGNITNVIIMVILLSVIGIVRHLLGLVFFSAKVLASLPIVHWVDKLLGIVVGIAETILIIWTIYIFVGILNLGAVEQFIMDYTAESQLLTWLSQNNYLAQLVSQFNAEFGSKISLLFS